MSAECVYCGLAVPDPWWGRAAKSDSTYCCFGCRFAHAVSRERQSASASINTLARLGISIFFAMNVMAFTMVLWGQDVYDLDVAGDPLAARLSSLFRTLCLVFSMPVLFLLGMPLAGDALRALRAGRPNADVLLLMGVVASFLFSADSVLRSDGPVYFEVGVVVLVLVTLGRWLEATGKQKATAALEALEKDIPATARRTSIGQSDIVIPTNDIQPGDWLRVYPGERLPCDGRIVHGSGAVDERIITGESTPPYRMVGDPVYGGTHSVDGELVIESTGPASESALARLVAAVRSASLARGCYQRYVDHLAAWFLPVVIVVALATMSFHAMHNGWTAGLMSGMAVLVIACPCALGVATPLAVWSTMGRLASDGIIIGSSEALEKLAAVRTVLFDKTGTITTDNPRVVAEACSPNTDRTRFATESRILATATNHPFSRAILNHIGSQSLPISNGHMIRSIPGRGVVCQNTGVMLGSPRFALDMDMAMPSCLTDTVAQAEVRGQPVVVIGWDHEVRGAFFLDEDVRATARSAISTLQKRGFNIKVLTGDTPQRGAAIGRELGINVVAGLLPEDKVQLVRDWQNRHGKVALIGDGLNDAPALAAADVGIAMGCGADLSRESADVCLLGDDLSQLPMLFDVAQRTMRTIRRNLFWAFAYNLIGLGWAVTGYLNPVIAATAMFLSSLFVVSGSWRLGTGQSTSACSIAPTQSVPA